MYSRNKMLTEVAEKRLGAIRDFTELGSGVKIAMRDLESVVPEIFLGLHKAVTWRMLVTTFIAKCLTMPLIL